MAFDGRELCDIYFEEFEIQPAISDRQRTEAFRLRHQVYCVENQFEPLSPTGLETDEYDQHSVHALLAHRRTATVIGSVRLILPRAHGSSPFYDFMRRSAPRQAELPRQASAEISRFAVSRVRLRSIYAQAGDRRVAPPTLNASLGLMAAILRLSLDNQVSHLCSLMEPSLIRMLGALGLGFRAVGPVLEFHGRRQACFRSIETLLSGAYFSRRDVWNLLTDRGAVWPAPSVAAAPFADAAD